MKPALTPEEWARWFASEHTDDVDGWSHHDVLKQAWTAAEVGNEHGVAATLLHGQPFGFHRKDVDFLRSLDYIHARDIAERIKALLPPESDNGEEQDP